MPLVKSSSDKAFKTNVSTLTWEIGKSPHVKNQKQALAIAYDVKRRNRAAGGGLKPAGWETRAEARGMMHAGPIMSAVAGRTDHHPMNVKAGSYVIPSDHVSSMGQGNTIAGVAQLNHLFKMGPFGSSPGVIKGGGGAPHVPRVKSSGGAAGKHNGEPVPINAAGGEFVVPPEKITEWMERSGFTPDLDAGHKALDRWVVEHRKKHRKTLAKLPGPAKS